MEAHDHPNFVHTKSIKLPKECYKNDTSCLVGQLAFADFDLDGQLDLIFPVCHDGTTCANSTIYFSSASKLMQVSYWFFRYQLWAPQEALSKEVQIVHRLFLLIALYCMEIYRVKQKQVQAQLFTIYVGGLVIH